MQSKKQGNEKGGEMYRGDGNESPGQISNSSSAIIPTPMVPSLRTAKTTSAPMQNAPQLLRQMELMMDTWTNTHQQDSASRNTEVCRSVLGLFISASGVYQDTLSKMAHHLFGQIDEQRARMEQLERQVASRSPSTEPGHTPRDNAVSTINTDQAAARCEFAFGKVQRAEKEIKTIFDAATSEREQNEAEIRSLKSELDKVKELLHYQATREKRRQFDSVDVWESRVRQTIATLILEKQVETLTNQVSETSTQVGDLTKKNLELLELNGRYARQAIELAVRVKIFSDHNEKFATLLALQYDERQSVERENELLRAELIEMSRLHQPHTRLEGEVGSITNEVVLRAVRYGFGSNPTVPRHLHFCGLLNRNMMHRDAALTLVGDILANRISQGTSRAEFQVAVHNFLTKKYCGDAVMWAYSLDEACRLYDADVNLAAFNLVSHRQIAEQIFQEINTDVSVFLEACEIIDEVQHGEVKLTVPVVHIFGLLLEMFPGYHDSAFRRIMEQLQATLTTNAHAHYPMLFPNRERESLSVGEAGVHAHIERRNENGFSAMFKELIVDDAVVVNQQIEDAIWHNPTDRLTIPEVVGMVSGLFDDSEGAGSVRHMVADALKDHQQKDKDSLDGTMSKSAVISAIRTRCILRRGSLKAKGQARLHQRAQLTSNAVSEWSLLTGEELLPIDYFQILKETKTQRIVVEPDELELSESKDDAEQ